MKIIKKIFVSCFIIIIFLSMIRTHLSFDSAFVRTIYSRIDPALSFFSFYQDWMMFAPNPNRTNSEFYAQIEFESGEIITFHFDSPSNLNHWDKYRGGEKLRKYFQDTISSSTNSFTYKDLARYVLRKVGKYHSDKIPLRVTLVQSKSIIPRPEIEFRTSKDKYLNFNNEVLYVHEVI